MGIARKLLLGGCALALLGVGAEAAARRAAKPVCARTVEYSAMEVIAVQQELMDAALTCGPEAVTNYNRFQTEYKVPLRKYDKTMLAMFKRLMGTRKGDEAYNKFKTSLAGRAEIRRLQHAPKFCTAADAKGKAAFDPANADLEDFAALSAPRDFVWPVEACSVLETRMAPIPDVMPQPNPVRVAQTEAAAVPPPAASQPPAAPPAQPEAPPTAP